MGNFSVPQGRIDGRFGCPTLADTAQELIQTASVRGGLLDFLIRVSKADGSTRWYADVQPEQDTYDELHRSQGPGSFFVLDTLQVAEKLVAGGILLSHGGVEIALTPTAEIRELTIGSIPVLRAGMQEGSAPELSDMPAAPHPAMLKIPLSAQV